jgi:hypothetical protein
MGLIRLDRSVMLIIDTQEQDGFYGDERTDADRAAFGLCVKRVAWPAALGDALAVPVVVTEEGPETNGPTAPSVLAALPRRDGVLEAGVRGRQQSADPGRARGDGAIDRRARRAGARRLRGPLGDLSARVRVSRRGGRGRALLAGGRPPTRPRSPARRGRAAAIGQGAPVGLGPHAGRGPGAGRRASRARAAARILALTSVCRAPLLGVLAGVLGSRRSLRAPSRFFQRAPSARPSTSARLACRQPGAPRSRRRGGPGRARPSRARRRGTGRYTSRRAARLRRRPCGFRSPCPPRRA